jgi:hypothetical protein
MQPMGKITTFFDVKAGGRYSNCGLKCFTSQILYLKITDCPDVMRVISVEKGLRLLH